MNSAAVVVVAAAGFTISLGSRGETVGIYTHPGFNFPKVDYRE